VAAFGPAQAGLKTGRHTKRSKNPARC